MKSVAISERHWKFLVTVTKMYSDGHYLPQISLPFHQVFFTVYNFWFSDNLWCNWNALDYYKDWKLTIRLPYWKVDFWVLNSFSGGMPEVVPIKIFNHACCIQLMSEWEKDTYLGSSEGCWVLISWCTASEKLKSILQKSWQVL